MKKLLFIIGIIAAYPGLYAQVKLKTEYFGNSKYHLPDADTGRNTGNGEGSAIVYQGSVNIPLSTKLNENKRPTMWAINIGGAYARLNNKNFTEPLVVDEIMNLGVGLIYLRPLKGKWSLMTTIGGGVYMPGTNFSQMKLKNVLASGGAVFICHLRSNLDLGGGLAINNSFGYPMLFPAFYFNWKTEGKYAVKVSAMRGLEMAVEYNANKNLALSFVFEMNGQMALLEQNGEDKIFTHQYLVIGLRPEIKLGRVSIPLTVGFNATRPARMMDRKLKSMFQEEEGHYFRIAPHASLGLNIKL
ncbi:DUF6268 family outer membrane beta-barrel protein [Filimonas effusa]|uniref:Histidine kinase n=1 Tax=Filimonas effusa TaxID=2508721 RepID=A0A4Q1D9G4_9BACT|nr:DUF6268 family outer membrane beta-barrel protein [Filimonas effusa]RXK85981.1 histidine kinase [Filimonas effusa]